jgi:dihydroorotate dehydrogenase
MPDWFYRTLARPVLWRLPDRWARRLALNLLGGLARFPGGPRCIDFLGHMRAPADLAVRVGGQVWSSPLLLGWRVDPERRATAALRRFGVGGCEFHRQQPHDVQRDAHGLRELGPWRARAEHETFPPDSLVRERTPEGGEWLLLSGTAQRWPVYPWDAAPQPELSGGVVLQVGTRTADGNWQIPAVPPPELEAQVRAWRSMLGAEGVLIVASGVAEPADAVALRAAGADLLVVDVGLVFSGPGLIKRANAALVAAQTSEAEEPCSAARDEAQRQHAWFWGALLGAALLGGGLLALGLAATRVLLPYDEHYLGLSAEALSRLNPRLLAFMAHDRGTLAGTMLGLGWLYLCLARGPLRERGDHAAWLALVASALTGFATFFYFLGFGYFDPLHAFVTAILLQFTLLLFTGRIAPEIPAPALDMQEDRVWRRAQWG